MILKNAILANNLFICRMASFPKRLKTNSDFKKEYLPHISIDTVIFGYHDKKMMVLLLQYKNSSSFALPGGFIKKEEDIDDAAKRILKDRTGLKNIYLEQFHTFGSNRRQDDAILNFMKSTGQQPTEDHFLLQRFISISYYALVDFTQAIPTKDDLSNDCKWVDIKKIPSLIQDHKQIIQTAMEALREDLDRKLVGFNLMPETFTMNELQGLYETITREKILRTSFQRKMLNLGILEVVDKKMTGGAHKAPYLYRFRK
jgi:8-oxo-dGTP diphosphatase